MKVQADIPRLVRDLRERTGLTQEKFAAKLGVTFPTINRWENGRAKPSKLAKAQLDNFYSKMIRQGKLKLSGQPVRGRTQADVPDAEKFTREAGV